jgi:hypothetical protein
MRRIVQRKLILKAPSEHGNCQPEEHKGESRQPWANWVREIHSVLFLTRKV